MNRILSKKTLPKELIRLEISTSLALKAIEPGQYIVLRTKPSEPPVTLPVIKADPDKGTLTVIASDGFDSAWEVAGTNTGNIFHAVDGPYGIPLQVNYSGTVLCVGDEKGVVALLPLMLSLRKAGNTLVAILVAPSAKQVMLEEEISALADQVIILTNDNSQCHKASLQQAIGRALWDHSIQGVLVSGNARTIRDTCTMTINHPIPTQALMVDTPPGKSVHGIFRVNICGNVRSVCVDGHDFNAYYATFDEMVRRFEQGAMEKTSVAKVREKAAVQA